MCPGFEPRPRGSLACVHPAVWVHPGDGGVVAGGAAGVMAGQRFGVGFVVKGRMRDARSKSRDMTITPGESKDLGDIKSKRTGNDGERRGLSPPRDSQSGGGKPRRSPRRLRRPVSERSL